MLAFLQEYPALTVGLPIFTLVLLFLDAILGRVLSGACSLYPGAIFHLDMNRVLLYLLFHQNLPHWLLNSVALATPLALYERTHGTVNTGITLNLLAVVTAIPYLIVGSLIFPNVHVVGLSGIVFLLLAFTAFKEHGHNPVLYTFKLSGREYSIPTLWSPFFFLLVSVFMPGSSFWGHLFGITTGYLLGMGKLDVLFPPLRAVIWIENKLARPISSLDGLVTFIREEDAVALRSVSYRPLFSTPEVNVAGNV